WPALGAPAPPASRGAMGAVADGIGDAGARLFAGVACDGAVAGCEGTAAGCGGAGAGCGAAGALGAAAARVWAGVACDGAVAGCEGTAAGCEGAGAGCEAAAAGRDDTAWTSAAASMRILLRSSSGRERTTGCTSPFTCTD